MNGGVNSTVNTASSAFGGLNEMTFAGGSTFTFASNVTIHHIYNPQDTDAKIILKPGKSFSVATQKYSNDTNHDMIFILPAHSEDVVLLADEQPAALAE